MWLFRRRDERSRVLAPYFPQRLQLRFWLNVWSANRPAASERDSFGVQGTQENSASRGAEERQKASLPSVIGSGKKAAGVPWQIQVRAPNDSSPQFSFLVAISYRDMFRSVKEVAVTEVPVVVSPYVSRS